jgi:GNAT superfamily N-acetyltransferase
VKLHDDVWQVICDYTDVADGTREWIEENLEITPFDGGAFIADGNEFDLFVVPERRGRWNIRGQVTKFLSTMGRKHGTLVAEIYEDNLPSLRLAKHFGFREVGRDGDMIRLESTAWAK